VQAGARREHACGHGPVARRDAEVRGVCAGVLARVAAREAAAGATAAGRAAADAAAAGPFLSGPPGEEETAARARRACWDPPYEEPCHDAAAVDAGGPSVHGPLHQPPPEGDQEDGRPAAPRGGGARAGVLAGAPLAAEPVVGVRHPQQASAAQAWLNTAHAAGQLKRGRARQR